jgi:hypothetical protein
VGGEFIVCLKKCVVAPCASRDGWGERYVVLCHERKGKREKRREGRRDTRACMCACLADRGTRLSLTSSKARSF